MRCFVIAMLAGGFRLASADTGIYASVAGGMAQYGGDLAPYDDPSDAYYTSVNDVTRVTLGLSLRRDDLTYTLSWAAMTPPLLWVNCDDEACDQTSGNNGTLQLVGFDVKRRWGVGIADRRQDNLGVFLALHGGPRYAWGSNTLTGYRGVGLDAGFALEVDAGRLGVFLDGGVTFVSMSMPVDAVTGWVPYLNGGLKLGWL